MLTTLPSPSAQTIRQSVPDQEDIIRRSLERSARYGVDPHLDGAPESTRLSDEQLRERINGQRVFYTLAKEQIDSLYRWGFRSRGAFQAAALHPRLPLDGA